MNVGVCVGVNVSVGERVDVRVAVELAVETTVGVSGSGVKVNTGVVGGRREGVDVPGTGGLEIKVDRSASRMTDPNNDRNRVLAKHEQVMQVFQARQAAYLYIPMPSVDC